MAKLRPAFTPTDAPKSQRRLRVRATAMGYYDHKRYREGDVFELFADADYSHRWMERVASSTPLREPSAPNEVLRKKHDEILGARHGGPAPAVGDSDDDDPLHAE